jgi:hypothetical protein
VGRRAADTGVLPMLPHAVFPLLPSDHQSRRPIHAMHSLDQMRNVIYAINLTLDGCCDHTKFNPDEEVLEHYTHLLRDFDLLVYGRKTYQLMVPYWPDIAKSQSETKADIEFAQAFVSKKKIVFSRSLDQR